MRTRAPLFDAAENPLTPIDPEEIQAEVDACRTRAIGLPYSPRDAARCSTRCELDEMENFARRKAAFGRNKRSKAA